MASIAQDDLHNVYVWMGEPFNVGHYVPRGTDILVTAGACPHHEHGKAYSLGIKRQGLNLQGMSDHPKETTIGHPKNDNAKK